MQDKPPFQHELSDSEALRLLIDIIDRTSVQSRPRLIETLATFLGIAVARQKNSVEQNPYSNTSDVSEKSSRTTFFSEDRTPTAKEFLLEKKPRTDVEKAACLAYYLEHYKQMPNFKTLDISKLNTEAAQLKFSNAAYAVDNAVRAGLLIATAKGHKKISALGELYVQALPDRAAAKVSISHAKPRKRSKKDKLSSRVDEPEQ